MLEKIRKAFACEGYTLLTNEYLDERQKLEYLCPEGHRHYIAWRIWRRGIRCYYCGRPQRDHKQVLAAFEQEGYVLLSQYRRRNQKLNFICPQGHRHAITYDSWLRKDRCGQCKYYTIEQVKQLFAIEGYRVLSNRYQNLQKPLEVKCPQKHVWMTTLEQWNNGVRCIFCRGKRLKHEFVEEILAAEGYELISEYKNVSSKIDYICPKGHKHKVRYADWKFKNQRCGICKDSRAEQELRDYFSFLNPVKTRSIITPYELDIYFEKLKVAIEYCGLYWHSTEQERIDYYYHARKWNLCRQKGIRLVTIFEDEWLNDRDECIKRLKQILLSKEALKEDNTITLDLRWDNVDIYLKQGYVTKRFLPPKVYQEDAQVFDCGYITMERSNDT